MPSTERVLLRGLGVVGGAGALAGVLAMVSYPRWRAWCLTWGASDEEITRALPGDDLLDDPDLVSTRAVSIDTAVGNVWPWLAQMGSGRGGLYTYDWIENLFGLHMHSTDVILPQFQDLHVGYAQRLGKNGPVLRVAVADENAELVLRSDDGNWVWAFCLMPDRNQTRLVSRNRISTPGASKLSRMFFKCVMEPGSLVMERKMLLGIKQRAEQLERTHN
jgi:hypothetical protein